MFKKPSKATQQPWSLKSVFAPGFWVLVTPIINGGDHLEAFGDALEAFGASKLILGPPLGRFGRLWETLGE